MAAKKATITVKRGRIVSGFGNNKDGVFQVGSIITQKDLPKGMDIGELFDAGYVEEYKGDLVGLSETALAEEIKALKEENEALKAMG